MAARRREIDSTPREAPSFGTLGELLRWRARTTPTAECMRFEGQSLSYAEVLTRAECVARLLVKRGVRPGDRVALMLPNGLDFPVAWLALPLLGAVTVPVNVKYGRDDLAHVFEHSGATHALIGSGPSELVQEVAGDREPPVDLLVMGTHEFEASLESATHLALNHAPRSDEVTTMQYTSGTTGLPKGCLLDHRYWINLANTFQEHVELAKGDVVLTAQPQSYMDPSWNLVLTLVAGVPLVILPRFSASTFWRDVRENRVTFFYCIGTMPLYLMGQPPTDQDRNHSVRLVYCSGIPPNQHREFEERWGCTWRETYGSTELGVVLLAAPSEDGSVGSGSMGRPVGGREVRVLDELGRTVVPGAVGELQVRGPDFMQCYYRDPEATQTWRNGEWTRTGDLVAQLDDGGFRLEGRLKDMIRRGGENISAAEVEAVLVEHPAVQAVACIPVPDALRGEEVKAYVQLTHQELAHGSDVPPTPAQLHAFVAARLAPFKVPRYFEFIPLIPLTQSEKIAKAVLIASRLDHRMGSWDAQDGQPPGATTTSP